MIAIPVNTGWFERAYSKLDMICTKRRNKLLVDNISYEIFLNVLSFSESYNRINRGIKSCRRGKEVPSLGVIHMASTLAGLSSEVGGGGLASVLDVQSFLIYYW